VATGGLFTAQDPIQKNARLKVFDLAVIEPMSTLLRCAALRCPIEIRAPIVPACSGHHAANDDLQSRQSFITA
jgi:hypothetical protein